MNAAAGDGVDGQTTPSLLSRSLSRACRTLLGRKGCCTIVAPRSPIRALSGPHLHNGKSPQGRLPRSGLHPSRFTAGPDLQIKIGERVIALLGSSDCLLGNHADLARTKHDDQMLGRVSHRLHRPPGRLTPPPPAFKNQTRISSDKLLADRVRCEQFQLCSAKSASITPTRYGADHSCQSEAQCDNGQI